MKTKRIKITDPKDLREGMRVEVEWGDKFDREPTIGKLFKLYPVPSDLDLCIDRENGRTYPVRNSNGEFDKKVFEVHRLIDGIEDLVVGDELKSFAGGHAICLAKVGKLYGLSNVEDSFELVRVDTKFGGFYTVNQLIALGFEVCIPEEEKTELTETEATTKPDSTEESEFGDDTNVATKEVKSQYLTDMINAVHREDPKSKDYIYAIAMSVQGALVHAGVWEQVKDIVALQPGEVKCNILHLRSNVDPRDPWDIVIKKDE